MADEQRENQHTRWECVLNRATIKRCVVTGFLTVPGALYAKSSTSIGITLANALIGCVVMVIASMPLLLFVSSPRYEEAISASRYTRNRAPLAIIATIMGIIVLASVVQGLGVTPARFLHLLVIIPLAAMSIYFTRYAMQAPLPLSWKTWIDAIVIASGALYGAIAGIASVPTPILIATVSIASGLLARGMIVRNETQGVLSKKFLKDWTVVLATTIGTSLIALLTAPAILPMAFPAIACWGFVVGALFISRKKSECTRSRVIMIRLTTLALFCIVLEMFAGTI